MLKEELQNLLRVQDLELTLEESLIVHGKNHEHNTTKVEEEIAELRAKISARTQNTYDRLRKKGIGIAREVGLRCKSCHMPMSISLVNAMRDAKQAPQCPNCNVILYPEAFGE